ncbi:MAG: hypothetical protein CVV27_02710, partial [Candidatus Melainabacteria bacterium HGW-Melainabacteria-1]
MEELIRYLQRQKQWLAEDIEANLMAWREDQKAAQAELSGIRIRIDAEGFLVWERFPELETIKRIRLLPEPPGGHAGPRGLLWIDPNNGRQQELLTMPADTFGGLVVAQNQVYLHAPALEQAAMLARTNIWVDTALPDTRKQHVDLQILPERDLLFVLHREAGAVHVYHLRDYQRLASWQLRTPGNPLALNLTFDRGGLKAYLTDNCTPQLWIADLATLELKLWKSGLGILGNILAAPEPGCLFVTILKPSFNLVYFDLDSMTPLYSVEIRGEPLTQRRLLAWDPFMAAPESDLLFYLAAREQSGQMLPVLNVIDALEVRTIKRTVVRSPVLPILLVSGPPNPFMRLRGQDFGDWLLAQELLSAEELAAARNPVTESVGPLQAAAVPAEALPHKNYDIYQPPPETEEIWAHIDRPAPHLELPPQAEDVIVDLLCWAFYRLTLTNLRVHNAEIQHLKKIAARIKAELQSKQAVLAKLEDVLGRFRFQTPIARASVLTLLAQRDKPDLIRLEDLCPLCQGLLDKAGCQACGFRLDLPEAEQLTLSQSSAEPAAQLMPGQIMIPLPEHKAVMTINLWRQPLSVLHGTELKSLGHGVRLPSQHLLAVDPLGNKLVELNAEGQVVWKAKLALKRPVMTSFYQSADGPRYLVVDQGNARVLELDRAGKNWRRYPSLKTPLADKLTQPTDVQLTPEQTWLISDPVARRVLECDAAGRIVRRLGTEQGLSSPVMARRQADGSTEVLDRDSGTIFSFDKQSQKLWEYCFWPLPNAEASTMADSLEPPDWACLIHNGEWLLKGANFLMLVAPRQQRLRWVAPLPDPADPQLKVGFAVQGGAEARKKQLDDFFDALRGMELFAREPDVQIEALSRHVQSLSFDVGDWLLHPGELGNALFFVRSGELEIIAPEKDQPVIFRVKAGQSCGTQAVLSLGDTSWRTGIRVSSETKLLMLERSEFKRAVVNFPRLFHLVRHLDLDHQRLFKMYRERKTEQATDQLRVRINETRVRDFPLFAGADDAFFEALAEVVHAIAFLPDKIVCQRGESGGSIYLILEGSVGIERRGESQPGVILSEGDMLGEMSLMLDQPRVATVRTLDYCKFFVIDEAPMRRLLERFPWLFQRLETLTQQRKQLNQADWSRFAAQSGLDRQDLPEILLLTGPSPDPDLIYLPSSSHDALAGFTQAGELLWYWGREAARQLMQPSRVQLMGSTLLVTDSGNDRILEIDLKSRKTLRKWTTSLRQPSAATLTPEGLLLVADTGNQRLVVIDETGREVWQYGLPEEILKPVYVDISPAGTLLFADAGMHKVYELSLEGRILWSHGRWRNAGSGSDQLNQPSWVQRQPDGSTLIADTGNQRLVWILPPAPKGATGKLVPEVRLLPL